ncbi:MAG: hypothetical protein Q8O12_01275 [Candidatus Omnitrophota bacterium]|nr:hypothetical protein [Candidatus Omnitrophota bacterium]
MDKALRSILWVLVGLVVLSSLSTAWFFLSKEKLYNEYTNLEELFKNTLEKLNTEITVANQEKTELKSKLQTIEARFNALEASHASLKSEHDTAISEKDDLKRDLASVKKGKAFLEKRLKEMESDMFVANLLKEKVGLEVEIERLRSEITPKDQELSRLKAESVEKDLKLANLENEKKFIEQKLKDSEQVAQILSNDFLKEKEAGKEDKMTSEKIAMENSALKSKMREFEGIAEEYNGLLSEKETMKEKIAKLENDIEYKNQEIGRFKVAFQENAGGSAEMRAEAYQSPGEVELPKIVLNKEPQKIARLTTPSLERSGENQGTKGRVVTVNKDHNFVVIDIGKQDGVEIGNRFNVYRGGAFLGSVEVIQARDRIAAADIKDLQEGMNIEINDIVVKR